MKDLLFVKQEDNGKIVVGFDMEISAAEFGIIFSDIFRHIENGRGREFAASVAAMVYKEMTKPTSGLERIQ